MDNNVFIVFIHNALDDGPSIYAVCATEEVAEKTVSELRSRLGDDDDMNIYHEEHMVCNE